MKVQSLGYIGIEASDLSAWKRYATEFLGLMPGENGASGDRYRIDNRLWRISVEQGERDDIAYAGFELEGPEALARMAGHLRDLGYGVESDSGELERSRQVRGLARCTDPSGLQVELYWGATERGEAPFRSALVDGFETGDQGLGHIVLLVPDVKAALKFYGQGLGFKLSDIITMPIGPDRTLELHFLHCNPRHHTLAFAEMPAPKRLQHFMLQVPSIDDVGFALDRAEQQSVPVTMTLGRHTNDQMVSFYARTPSGFEVEYGAGAVSVDESWTVVSHDRISLWGHHRTSQ
ncbi:2,3-dihydroxybiphenyl 1,2-dioxygenase [Burkholderia sp. MS455]|uniref:VOC family protein n=1 Tax=Burkholderia sp. MS455 TaxID=2811788 RepID=UPI00195DCD33|nr:VOC family protein [Burkholderia sp. MS455]QRR08007.1 2,3-dihydroxybiphenyl 1,2-dioxygenase [Burkholderia sp. MS455]